MKIGKFETELSSYLWVLPFIGGLIAIISLITPAGYIVESEGNSFKFWIWGMWVSKLDRGVVAISNNIFLEGTYLISGIISSFIILTTSVIVMMDALRMRRKKISIENKKNLWTWCGILILIATMLWMIEISFVSYYDIMVEFGAWENYYSPPTADDFTTPFWFYFEMDFGVIGPLINGSLLIFTRILIKR
ncbi:MAG: hypothetical protein ACFFEO_08380 [Candidatus Thorarchaeota archaeon]